MRLLNVDTLKIQEFFSGSIPVYAILSHTWAADELSFSDVVNGLGTAKKGYEKLLYCSQQDKKDGVQYVWMYTCCIDKASSSELSEAINSMFRWYQNAYKCYAYLEDVSSPYSLLKQGWVSIEKNQDKKDERPGDLDQDWKEEFRGARWWTRGWTLQELLAPKSVLFFSKEWVQLGDKESLQDEIQNITGIDRKALQGHPLSNYSAKEVLSWAKQRQCTRVEDKAYCLLGIFDVSIPLIYGERDRALRRLVKAVAEITDSYKLITDRPSHTSTDARNLTAYLTREETRNPGDANGNKQRQGISNPRKGGSYVSAPRLPPSGQELSEQDDSGDQDRGNLIDIPPSAPLGPSLMGYQLRILTLHDGIIGDRLEGQVQEFSFSDAPPYYALSYTWGDEPDLRPMFLNGNMRLIRSNLFHALQQLRLRSGSIHIWIDSICINQEDEVERNSQVRQMADIYRSAAGVMVWLGETEFTSNLAMDLVEKIVQPKFSWKGLWWKDYGFVALTQILERPWFRRRWVLQEAALSNNTTVYCGDRQIYMRTFSDAVGLVRAKLSKTTPLDVQVNQSSPFAFLAIFRDSPAIRLLDIIETVYRRSTLPLETLVDLARFSDTTDHRDTIYSLLSLAHSVSTQSMSLKSTFLIEPDYIKTVLDVYADFISHCIHQSGSLDIICRPWPQTGTRYMALKVPNQRPNHFHLG